MGCPGIHPMGMNRSSPALLLVWIGPKLPFSVLYHTRAEVKGWDDPRDGVIHEAFLTLTVDLLLGDVNAIRQSWASFSSPSRPAEPLCAPAL